MFFDQAVGFYHRTAYLLSEITRVEVVNDFVTGVVDYLYDVTGIGKRLTCFEVLALCNESTDPELYMHFLSLVTSIKFQLMGFGQYTNYHVADYYSILSKARPKIVDEMITTDITSSEGISRFSEGIDFLKENWREPILRSYRMVISGKHWERDEEEWLCNPPLFEKSGFTKSFYTIRRTRTSLWPWPSGSPPKPEKGMESLILFDKDSSLREADDWFKLQVDCGRAALRTRDFGLAFMSLDPPFKYETGMVRDPKSGEVIVPPLKKKVLGEEVSVKKKRSPSKSKGGGAY